MIMKIVLIGHTGYVGSFIHEDLVTTYSLECLHSSQIPNSLSMYDVILYFGGRSLSTDSRESLFETNVNAFSRFLDHVRDDQLVIYASTGLIYSQEESPYTQSMQSRECIAKTKRTIGLRMGSVAGVSFRSRRGLAINEMYYSGLTNHTISVWNKSASRTILWKDDLLSVIRRLIETRDQIQTPCILNVGSFNTTVDEIASFIARHTHSTLVLKEGDDSKGFTMDLQDMIVQPQGTMEIIHEHYMKHQDTFLYNMNKCCIICQSDQLQSVLDLGYQPLSNEFTISKVDLPTYPLHLYRCAGCFHTQLGYFVNRVRLFSHYLYESGVSETIKSYFHQFAEHYTARGSKKVLEIACNDGSQLDSFKSMGWETYGVDPARNIVTRCLEKGHDIDIKFWGEEPTKFDNETFDLIVAQNVFAHVTNPLLFLKACKHVMNDYTTLVIQTSQSEMFFNNEFDTIYHEHVSFFTVRSMLVAANSVGLVLSNVRKTPIHGVSYIFELVIGKTQTEVTLLHDEERLGLYTPTMYQRYASSVCQTKTNVLCTLSSYKARGYSIIGYGAAAKGNVFLNYVFDSSPHELCPLFIVDDSPLKQDTFTPGTQIEVTNRSRLLEYTNKKVCVVLLAWNFAENIIRNVHELCPSAICIQFYPRFVEHRNTSLQTPQSIQTANV